MPTRTPDAQSSAQENPEIVNYQLCSESINVDTSTKACKSFGYSHGDRVRFSMDGRRFQNATVKGVKDGKLFFYIDGQDGVMCFPKFKKPRHFKEHGFKLISEGNKKERGMLEYQLCSESINLDTSDKACKKFGYLNGNRVRFSMNGRTFQYATVIGVNNKKLFFYIDGQDGVMCFPKYKKPRHFKEHGFKLISEKKRIKIISGAIGGKVDGTTSTPVPTTPAPLPAPKAPAAGPRTISGPPHMIHMPPAETASPTPTPPSIGSPVVSGPPPVEPEPKLKPPMLGIKPKQKMQPTPPAKTSEPGTGTSTPTPPPMATLIGSIPQPSTPTPPPVVTPTPPPVAAPAGHTPISKPIPLIKPTPRPGHRPKAPKTAPDPKDTLSPLPKDAPPEEVTIDPAYQAILDIEEAGDRAKLMNTQQATRAVREGRHVPDRDKWVEVLESSLEHQESTLESLIKVGAKVSFKSSKDSNKFYVIKDISEKIDNATGEQRIYISVEHESGNYDIPIDDIYKIWISDKIQILNHEKKCKMSDTNMSLHEFQVGDVLAKKNSNDDDVIYWEVIGIGEGVLKDEHNLEITGLSKDRIIEPYLVLRFLNGEKEGTIQEFYQPINVENIRETLGMYVGKGVVYYDIWNPNSFKEGTVKKDEHGELFIERTDGRDDVTDKNPPLTQKAFQREIMIHLTYTSEQTKDVFDGVDFERGDILEIANKSFKKILQKQLGKHCKSVSIVGFDNIEGSQVAVIKCDTKDGPLYAHTTLKSLSTHAENKTQKLKQLLDKAGHEEYQIVSFKQTLKGKRSILRLGFREEEEVSIKGYIVYEDGRYFIKAYGNSSILIVQETEITLDNFEQLKIENDGGSMTPAERELDLAFNDIPKLNSNAEIITWITQNILNKYGNEVACNAYKWTKDDGELFIFEEDARVTGTIQVHADTGMFAFQPSDGGDGVLINSDTFNAMDLCPLEIERKVNGVMIGESSIFSSEDIERSVNEAQGNERGPIINDLDDDEKQDRDGANTDVNVLIAGLSKKEKDNDNENDDDKDVAKNHILIGEDELRNDLWQQDESLRGILTLERMPKIIRVFKGFSGPGINPEIKIDMFWSVMKAEAEIGPKPQLSDKEKIDLYKVLKEAMGKLQDDEQPKGLVKNRETIEGLPTPEEVMRTQQSNTGPTIKYAVQIPGEFPQLGFAGLEEDRAILLSGILEKIPLHNQVSYNEIIWNDDIAQWEETGDRLIGIVVEMEGCLYLIPNEENADEIQITCMNLELLDINLEKEEVKKEEVMIDSSSFKKDIDLSPDQRKIFTSENIVAFFEIKRKVLEKAHEKKYSTRRTAMHILNELKTRCNFVVHSNINKRQAPFLINLMGTIMGSEARKLAIDIKRGEETPLGIVVNATTIGEDQRHTESMRVILSRENIAKYFEIKRIVKKQNRPKSYVSQMWIQLTKVCELSPDPNISPESALNLLGMMMSLAADELKVETNPKIEISEHSMYDDMYKEPSDRSIFNSENLRALEKVFGQDIKGPRDIVLETLFMQQLEGSNLNFVFDDTEDQIVLFSIFLDLVKSGLKELEKL